MSEGADAYEQWFEKLRKVNEALECAAVALGYCRRAFLEYSEDLKKRRAT